ncbi:hypothetical protein CROQUDRAFT_44651 [Cronartium quercuum f. sp. fusiforme G11]|uniref:Amino acid transporter transmembrane domain-containing protein n=1 Tax=Cronartium quercuum f. sp. fusiforme G11 TaxID=708437 RepID=A0A9P6NMN0_9BASI|nr:hypothetical protein CROQUDRAFT_44651 [Cronartium quercuum f. sp. fusiforme G11]
MSSAQATNIDPSDGLGFERTTKQSTPLAKLNPQSTSTEGQQSDLTYPPRLASTIASREYAFEADSDTLSTDGDHSTQIQQGYDASKTGPPLLALGDSPESGHREGGAIYNEDDEEPLLPSSSVTKDNRSDSPRTSTDYVHLLDAGGGLFAGVANMANSILGAGIIGLPYALRNAGFLTGTCLIVCLGFITDWSIRLIATNSKFTGQRTYIGILEQCFGFPGKAAVSFFQFSFAFGGMCAFGVIVGDTIPHVLTALLPFLAQIDWLAFLFTRSFVIIFFTLTVSYPLSLYREISKLSKASTLALLSMVIIVISVAVKGPTVDLSLKGDPKKRWSVIESGLTEAIGVISFAFVCHHNSLLIYGSLKTPTLDRFARVIHVSTALSVIACLVMSFSGFLAFTDRTQANVLNNFPNDDFVINIARVCFGLNMFTTLPLECFVCRDTIETFFYEDKPFDQVRHVIYTTLLVGTGLIISLSTCDLGIVLELTGGFAASALAFVFPAACHLKLSSKSVYATRNLGALAMVVFGVGVMVISTVGSLAKAFDPTQPGKVCH